MEKTINLKSNSGVSIVEIMISLVLVALALIAISSTFPSINRNRKGIQEADQAKILATQVLEGLQFLTVDGDCAGLTGNYEKECKDFLKKYKPANGIGSETIGTMTYNVAWAVSATPAAWGGNTAKVTVSWTKSGKSHDVSITGAL